MLDILQILIVVLIMVSAVLLWMDRKGKHNKIFLLAFILIVISFIVVELFL